MSPPGTSGKTQNNSSGLKIEGLLNIFCNGCRNNDDYGGGDGNDNGGVHGDNQSSRTLLMSMMLMDDDHTFLTQTTNALKIFSVTDEGRRSTVQSHLRSQVVHELP
jgi:hypothetical protein